MKCCGIVEFAGVNLITAAKVKCVDGFVGVETESRPSEAHLDYCHNVLWFPSKPGSIEPVGKSICESSTFLSHSAV